MADKRPKTINDPSTKVVLTVTVCDEAVRRDWENDDVRRVYPDLPNKTWLRNAFVKKCDIEAYHSIKHEFPEFAPQGYDPAEHVENRSP